LHEYRAVDGFHSRRTRSTPVSIGTANSPRAVSGQHRRIGLDRDDFGAQRDQHGGQLAGSGTEFEHPRPGRGLERPAHRRLRVARRCSAYAAAAAPNDEP
jgi:hypothetical protein